MTIKVDDCNDIEGEKKASAITPLATDTCKNVELQSVSQFQNNCKKLVEDNTKSTDAACQEVEYSTTSTKSEKCQKITEENNCLAAKPSSTDNYRKHEPSKSTKPDN